MGFGERLREARKDANITQEELSKELNISINCIANYERGTSFPKEKYLFRIINRLGADPNYLFQDELDGPWLWGEERRLVEEYRKMDKRGRYLMRELTITNNINKLTERLANKDKNFTVIKFDVNNSIYGTLSEPYSSERNKMKHPKYKLYKSNAEDCACVLKVEGSAMEPFIKDGQWFSMVYADSLENGQIGLFDVGGFAVVAIKRSGKVYNLKTKDIFENEKFDTPRFLGRIIEFHKIDSEHEETEAVN
ncbi:MAG: helix-turn-helix domain-containing protein [Clostridiales bacterium]|nr:helix-turn-helix domain-containing protein [Clostridiales bacterium]